MLKRTIAILFAILALACLSSCGPGGKAVVFHVSPSGGSDGNPGTEAAPFATLTKAREEVRKRIRGGMTCDVAVLLHEGAYDAGAGLRFDSSDSGRDGYSVIYGNYKGQKPVITGTEGNVLLFFGKSAQDPVANIVLDGLAIEHCGPSAKKGWDDGETGGNGIFIENAKNIRIKNCSVRNVEGNGIYLHHSAMENTIEGCEIKDAGRNGIYLRGIFYSGAQSNVNKNNTVANNHIFNCVKGSGILAWQSGGNTISHNRIHHTGQYCISFKSLRPGNIAKGMVIDGTVVTRENAREFRNSGNNVCEFNDLSDANLIASDTGVIESWGGAPGNVIRYNYVHGSASAGGEVFAVYLDDAADGFTVEKNIFAGIPGAEAVFFTKGVGNIVRNNIIADCSAKSIFLSRAMFDEPSNSLEYGKNIVYGINNELFTFLDWQPDRVRHSDFNLFFDKDGGNGYKVTGAGDCGGYDDWTSLLKFDAHSVAGRDPAFVDAAGGDYRPLYDSPAYELGFEDFNLDGIGLTSAFGYADPGEKIDRLFVRDEKEEANKSHIELRKGERASLVLTARTSTGFIASLEGAAVSFESDNEKVAAVNAGGIVKATGGGIAAVTATVAKDGVEKRTRIHILVDDFITGLRITVPRAVFLLNETAPVYVTAEYQSGRKAILKEGEYKLAGSAGCFEFAGGTIKAVSYGEDRVTASLQNCGGPATGEIGLKVSDRVLSGIEVSASGDFAAIGEKIRLAIKGTDHNGRAMDIPAQNISIEVGDGSILEAGEGLAVTAVGPGTATIGVTATLDGITCSARVDITVRPEETGLPGGWIIDNFNKSQGFAVLAGGTFHVLSTGFDIFGAEDDFTFIHKRVPVYEQGAIAITATIDELQNIGSADSAAGIMMRGKNTADSDNVNIRVLPSGELRMVYRNADSPKCDWRMPDGNPALAFPVRLKLVRKGPVVTGYYMADGGWVELASARFEASGGIEMGVALMSHVDGKTISAKVSGVEIGTDAGESK